MDIHPHGSPPALIQNVMEYIHAHFSEEINIQDIASQFSITPAYLIRLFKKQTNIPPIEYLTKYRIEQACYYFTHTLMSIGEVAELCGCSNQFYFSKAFKAVKGMSPSEYKIKYQEELYEKH